MDATLIRKKVDQLAFGTGGAFSYNELVTGNENQVLWAVQVALSQCYKYEFRFGLEHNANLTGNVEFYQFRAQIEQYFQVFVKERLLTREEQWDITKSGEDYIDYLKHFISTHPSSHHRFFTEFMPKTATKDDLRFFLAQETVPRFDDIVSLIQIGNPMQMKMELARNYWDEMGNGDFSKAHTTMFAEVLKFFNVTEEYSRENILESSMVFDNLSSMLAIYRENYAHAIGFLAVTEYCVPERFRYFIEACRRLGVDDDVLAYHALHSDIDTDHANGWFEQIVKPLVDKDPNIANKITEGVTLKLNLSQYFFDGILEKTLQVKEDCVIDE